MRSISLLLVVLLCSVCSAHAQLKGFSIGPYVEAAWPRGDFAQSNRNGIGAGLAADIKLGNHLAAMGSYGILHFGAQRGSDFSGQTINARPLRLGLKYKLPLLYFKMESGSAKLGSGMGNAVILSPGVGIRLLGLDLQGSYESWLGDQHMSFASLKLAYHF